MILMIDAKNCLYRAIFAKQRTTTKDHTAVLMLRFITGWIRKFSPSSVYVFWDVPKSTVWRMKYHGGYKDREGGNDRLYSEHMKKELASIEAVLHEVFDAIGVFQFKKKEMEADDLIYAACKVHYPSKITIVSSDSDLLQIKYHMPNVDIYDANKNLMVDTPTQNPVYKKALIGDTSDVINGYKGIGPVKGSVILESVSGLAKFVIDTDMRLFLRNLMLIDLSLCPALLTNQMHVMKKLNEGTIFNKKKLIDLIDQYKLSGLRGELTNLIYPFKPMATKVVEDE